MAFKVVDIHTGEPTFESWLEEVFEQNSFKGVKRALLFWEDPKNIHLAKLNCDADDLSFIKTNLEDYIFKVKVRDFLADHINEFLQYVEQ